jgi:hypothetical protein
MISKLQIEKIALRNFLDSTGFYDVEISNFWHRAVDDASRRNEPNKYPVYPLDACSWKPAALGV